MKKVLLNLLLVACVAAAFPAAAQPPIPESRTERHNGNVFFFPPGKMDTIEVVDPVLGETVMQTRILNVTRPITMNGKHIYNNAEVTTPVERRKEIIPFSFEEYLLNKIKPDLATLKDGSYYLHLNDIVVDKNGVVQYYWSDTLSVLRKAVAREMKRPLFVPAKIGNKKVTAIYECYTSSFEIVVKGHEVRFIRDKVFPTVKSNM